VKYRHNTHHGVLSANADFDRKAALKQRNIVISCKEQSVFERYTEKARRTIFFTRYEASRFGSPQIESEHLLLGVLRESHALTEDSQRPDPWNGRTPVTIS
jgi:Clp amino terminal domain, pathogenicity island component